MLRTLLLAAVVGLPMAVMPASASAQEAGLDRAAEATANADANAAWTKNRAEKRPDAMPLGIQKVFDNETLPPGMRRHFGAPEPEPEPDVQQDDGAGCSEVVFPDGTVICV